MGTTDEKREFAIKRAAAVIPRRPDGTVLLGRRTEAARSFPGYLAFPGGGLEPNDHLLPTVDNDPCERDLRACAIRELGEESGRWLVANRDGTPLRDDVKTQFQEALTRGDAIEVALSRTGAALDDRALIPLGLWVTSDVRPARFAVRQYLLQVVEDDMFVTVEKNDELDQLTWRHPIDVEFAWTRGDELLLPPIRHVVTTLASAQTNTDATTSSDDESAITDLVERLSQVRPPFEPEARDIVRGIAVQPHRTPTLLPATTTNTVLVGVGDFLIVDPATPYPEERARFDALLAVLRLRGRRPLGILLTHHHPDHVGDVARLRETLGVPVMAHVENKVLVDFPIDRTIAHNERIVVDGDFPLTLRALFTPGHAKGHLCFLVEETGVLIAGDMVAGEGSILIDPDEGHMGTYLQSLELLLDEGDLRVVPAHGPLLAAGRARILEHKAHRLRRQTQVHDALMAHGDDATPDALVPAIYGATVSSEMIPLAARSVRAALTLLVEEGRARAHGGGFSVVVDRSFGEDG